jgi:hypothetical protein
LLRLVRVRGFMAAGSVRSSAHCQTAPLAQPDIDLSMPLSPITGNSPELITEIPHL